MFACRDGTLQYPPPPQQAYQPGGQQYYGGPPQGGQPVYINQGGQNKGGGAGAGTGCCACLAGQSSALAPPRLLERQAGKGTDAMMTTRCLPLLLCRGNVPGVSGPSTPVVTGSHTPSEHDG